MAAKLMKNPNGGMCFWCEHCGAITMEVHAVSHPVCGCDVCHCVKSERECPHGFVLERELSDEEWEAQEKERLAELAKDAVSDALHEVLGTLNKLAKYCEPVVYGSGPIYGDN